MVRVLTVAVLQIVTSFNYTYSGRCSTRHRLFKRLHSNVQNDILNVHINFVKTPKWLLFYP